jgi:TetR/AcrR family transcriptional regulator, lmrAB and yxaGH operons repressor
VRDAVVAMFDAYVVHLERTRYTEGCPVATVALDAAASHDLLAEATGRALQEWVEVFATALEAEGREAAEAHGLATLVIAAVEGTVVMAKGERSTEPIAAARDVLATVLAPA